MRCTVELAHAVVGAQQTGLLGRLGDTTDTVDGHAAALDLYSEGVAKLLPILVDSGFAVRDGDRYGPSDGLRALVDKTPHGLGGLTRVWDHLPAYLRTGEPMMRANGVRTERQRVYAGVVAALGKMFAPSATALAAALAPIEPRTVLDVGAGSGVWSLALASVVPELRVTALDLEPVLAAFRTRAAELGLADRVSTVAQSFHDEPLGAGSYDVVLLAAVLHLEPPLSAAALITRASRAVAPAGRLVIVDALRGRGADALPRSLYAMNLALRTRGGAPHDEDAIVGWLRDARAVAIDRVDLPFPGLGALVATMPG
ncbi:MAG: class I SAM-dependent methyltransferase [Polyangiaceae bacterium]